MVYVLNWRQARQEGLAAGAAPRPRHLVPAMQFGGLWQRTD
jgi:hypothetical protein